MPFESSPEGVLDKSLEDVEGKAEAGMPYVEHIIGAINVFDITVVVVVPANWPSLIVSEPIAAVLEAVIPADHLGTPHVEGVVVTEVRTVADVRNAAIMVAVVPVATVAVIATVVGSGLSLLPSGLLRLLLALGLRMALRLLLALGLCLALRLLLALRLILVLRLLGVLWLRLALCWLCFSFASALLLLAFLCERRNGGYEK
jgi:hypothetical protein